ncbi:cupin domain-containing protein [Mycolicibacterium sp.]|uniref:cupin domain-containing protein n=1 Tax=Mycolicibacterium sp. TaxID=2320850 RepID=UPI003D0D14A8
MTELAPNSVVRAADLDLAYEAVPDEQRVDGEPRTGAAALAGFHGVEVGVWEMTPGTATDVEVDEVFVVLSGSATVEFAGGSPTLHVGAGDVVRLAAGAATTWTVTETLRKIYLTEQ